MSVNDDDARNGKNIQKGLSPSHTHREGKKNEMMMREMTNDKSSFFEPSIFDLAFLLSLLPRFSFSAFSFVFCSAKLQFFLSQRRYGYRNVGSYPTECCPFSATPNLIMEQVVRDSSLERAK
jgi:hypothetical protein